MFELMVAAVSHLMQLCPHSTLIHAVWWSVLLSTTTSPRNLGSSEFDGVDVGHITGGSTRCNGTLEVEVKTSLDVKERG